MSNSSINSNTVSLLSQFISGPLKNPKTVEMVIAVSAITFTFILSLLTTIGLEIYLVLFKDFIWSPVDFATAIVTEFGIAGTIISILAFGLGFKIKSLSIKK